MGLLDVSQTPQLSPNTQYVHLRCRYDVTGEPIRLNQSLNFRLCMGLHGIASLSVPLLCIQATHDVGQNRGSLCDIGNRLGIERGQGAATIEINRNRLEALLRGLAHDTFNIIHVIHCVRYWTLTPKTNKAHRTDVFSVECVMGMKKQNSASHLSQSAINEQAILVYTFRLHTNSRISQLRMI